MDTLAANRGGILVIAVMLLVSISFAASDDLQTEVGRSAVAFDSAVHDDFEASRKDSGYEIRLMGLAVLPYKCAQPDSSIPIEIPCGPNPYSHSIALFVVIEAIDVDIELLDMDMKLLASVGFGQLGVGPYGIDFTGPDMSPGLYWVQVCHNGKLVGRTKVAFVGSR